MQAVICRHLPDALGLPYALWSRAAVRNLVLQRCGVRLAVRSMGRDLARWATPPRSRYGAPTSNR